MTRIYINHDVTASHVITGNLHGFPDIRALNAFFIYSQQEPGANGTEILNMLRYVRPGGNFQPEFELAEKIQVNGPNEHPLYTYIKVQTPNTKTL